MQLVWVGIGGFVGAALRYLVSLGLNAWWQERLPWGTLLVNVVGGFLIGLLAPLSARFCWSERTRLMVSTGFLGGLTTFSTFGLETITYLKEGLIGRGILYLGLQVGLTLLGVAVGLWLGKQFTAA